MNLRHGGRSVIGAVSLALCVLVEAPATAEQVTLTSLDGGITLQGEFLSYDGSVYRIRTLLGELQVNVFRVKCWGDGCPSVEEGVDEFTIAGSS